VRTYFNFVRKFRKASLNLFKHIRIGRLRGGEDPTPELSRKGRVWGGGTCQGRGEKYDERKTCARNPLSVNGGRKVAIKLRAGDELRKGEKAASLSPRKAIQETLP